MSKMRRNDRDATTKTRIALQNAGCDRSPTHPVALFYPFFANNVANEKVSGSLIFGLPELTWYLIFPRQIRKPV
jgi:hypothetical protein